MCDDNDNELMPQEAYRNIAAGIVSVAKELADVEYQERHWIRVADPTVMASYEEAMAAFFDDYDVYNVIENAEKYGFLRTEVGKLQELATQAALFVDGHPGAVSRDAVASPDWIYVRRAASDFVESLRPRSNG